MATEQSDHSHQAQNTPATPLNVGGSGPIGPEDDLWTDSPSLWAGLGRFVIAAAITIAMIVITAFVGWAQAKYPFGIVVSLAWAWALFGGFYVRYANLYRLTNQRMFVRRGLLSQTTDQTELVRVDDVQVSQSLVQRLLKLGDVIVLSADATDGRCTLQDIKGPHHVAEVIREHTRRLRQRSLYIENI